MAAERLDHWEIVDYASAGKPDVPSGTSRELAETMAQVRTSAAAVPLSELHGPVEARGAEVGGTRIHSVRLPSFVATNGVRFGERHGRRIIRPTTTPSKAAIATLLQAYSCT